MTWLRRRCCRRRRRLRGCRWSRAWRRRRAGRGLDLQTPPVPGIPAAAAAAGHLTAATTAACGRLHVGGPCRRRWFCSPGPERDPWIRCAGWPCCEAAQGLPHQRVHTLRQHVHTALSLLWLGDPAGAACTQEWGPSVGWLLLHLSCSRCNGKRREDRGRGVAAPPAREPQPLRWLGRTAACLRRRLPMCWLREGSDDCLSGASAAGLIRKPVQYLHQGCPFRPLIPCALLRLASCRGGTAGRAAAGGDGGCCSV